MTPSASSDTITGFAPETRQIMYACARRVCSSRQAFAMGMRWERRWERRTRTWYALLQYRAGDVPDRASTHAWLALGPTFVMPRFLAIAQACWPPAPPNVARWCVVMSWPRICASQALDPLVMGGCAPGIRAAHPRRVGCVGFRAAHGVGAGSRATLRRHLPVHRPLAPGRVGASLRDLTDGSAHGLVGDFDEAVGHLFSAH